MSPSESRPPTTTDAGIPVASQEHSLTVGPDGPVLLQDFYLIEQMANFNRERIPERQPHAKGGGAFGTFVVTGDVSAFTKAALFQPGTETEVVVRFSTVAGERGSPDTWRDPRGFAGGSTPARATSTSSGTTRRSFSSATRSSSRTSSGPKSAWRPTTCVTPTCNGTFGRSRRVGPPGHLAHGRPRHPFVVASHERLLVAHLHVGQCGGGALLGEVPLQVRPGRRVPDPGRGGPDRRGGCRLPPA